MGQKVNPIGFRTGVMEDWKSRWYASKREFAGLLVEDHKLRKHIKAKYAFAGIAKVEIERTRDEVKVVMHAARPGVIIGRKGQEVERLQEELQGLIQRRVNIKIDELSKPALDAQLVADDVCEQLSKRQSFRRTMKRTLEKVMEAGALGCKVELAGRLGGAEMARREKASLGSLPLSTLRAKISYGTREAKTAQGHIGVKVWVNQGDYLDEEIGDGANAKKGQVPKKSTRSDQG